jgi:hypothetical protein
VLWKDPLGGVGDLFDNPMREIVALASGVVYGGDCVVEGVMGVPTTSFEARFCGRRGRVKDGGGPES